MSRAVFSPALVLTALTLAPVSVHADPRGAFQSVQGPVATVAARPAAADGHRRLQPGPALVVQPVSRFYTEPVWRSEEVIVRQAKAAPQPRSIRPLSGNPVEPGAVVSRTPSGRVVIGLPPGYILPAATPAIDGVAGRPYAPPQFHIIGAPSTRHMGAPVKLTHGLKPPEALQTGPKVVWLEDAGSDDAGGRVKRLR